MMILTFQGGIVRQYLNHPTPLLTLNWRLGSYLSIEIEKASYAYFWRVRDLLYMLFVNYDKFNGVLLSCVFNDIKIGDELLYLYTYEYYFDVHLLFL